MTNAEELKAKRLAALEKARAKRAENLANGIKTVRKTKSAKIKEKVANILKKIYDGKSSEVKPKRYAIIDNKEVELVFYRWYFENKELSKLWHKAAQIIEKKLNLEVTACADHVGGDIAWKYI